MKCKKIAAATILAAILTTTGCGIKPLIPAGEPAETPKIAEYDYTAAVQFTNNFAAESAEIAPPHKNTLSSPLSVFLAMSMAKEGASGATFDEMETTLGQYDSDAILQLMSHLLTLEDTQLTLANSVWADEDKTINPGWMDIVSQFYLAPTFQLELAKSADKVNSWIADQTNDLIRDMVSDELMADARLLLVNALYLDAQWEQDFDADDTIRGRKFTNSDGGVSIADYLHDTSSRLTIDTGDCLGVVLPYSDGSLEFVAVMPKDPSLPTRDLTAKIVRDGGFAALADKAEQTMIELYLPKFQHKQSASIAEVLAGMGIETAFTVAADFAGIAEDLYITDVLQSAVLRIDEEGTEAGASTVVVMQDTAADVFIDQPKVVDFNRPFSFALIDRATGVVLFAGEHNIA